MPRRDRQLYGARVNDAIHICHRCEFRKRPCAGACPCGIDGRDIIDHARAGDCPKDFFRHPPEPAAPARFGPGAVVTAILDQIGYTKTDTCGCRAFAIKMDGWGWVGCWVHREEITAWFMARAKEQNIEVETDSVWGLVLAGMKDIRRRRRGAMNVASSALVE